VRGGRGEAVSLVTLSATYGAGGSEVGPDLAERLGVPFVDRLIPTQVAADLGMRQEHEEGMGGFLSRLLVALAPIGQALGAPPGSKGAHRDDEFREIIEQVIFELADRGRGVILGRAAAVVLRNEPRALHVRLDGPPEARLAQAMRIQNVSRPVAERRMKETDPARHAYVRRFYHADARDPALYHLIIDSTALDLGDCVELIAAAAESRERRLAEAL
jgi:cytidylate kinase